MRPAAKILQFATLVAGVFGTLKIDCGTSIAGMRSRLSDLLMPHPTSQYKTFCGSTPPQLETWQSEQPCDDALLFVTPGEAAEGSAMENEADVEGPAIFRSNGDLVWTQDGWGRTRDLKVQTVGHRSYMTFWHDESSRHDGGASYVVLDRSYEMVKELRPVGEISSRPVELKLTDDGTAIILMHNATKVHTPFGSLQNGWINDAIIQEIDMKSNELVFEWRASHHFNITMSQAPIENQGRTPETAFDFFHATGIDLDHKGDYVISSRNMCNAVALRRGHGNVLWVVGGKLNSFEDASGGEAAAMISSQGVQWYGDSTLLLLDGGHVPDIEDWPGRRSNARTIYINTNTNMAALLRTYSTPAVVTSRHSKGTVQRLRNGNVFVGWGDDNPLAAAYTEYSEDGRALCAARFREASVASARLKKMTGGGGGGGRVVSKYAWTGTPAAQPVIVVRPHESALYVSWNGDTQSTAWLLRSNNTERGDGSLGARCVVDRAGFETRIPIPRDVGEVIEIMGVDDRGRTLVRSELIWSEGASGTWSTQRVLEASTDEDVFVVPSPSWQQRASAGRHCRLKWALQGLGLSVAALVCCRRIPRQWWKGLREAEWRYPRQMVMRGEKSAICAA
ncbi:hypothetical protein MY11210_004611 [Beauveria gryllotalpidicola]